MENKLTGKAEKLSDNVVELKIGYPENVLFIVRARVKIDTKKGTCAKCKKRNIDFLFEEVEEILKIRRFRGSLIKPGSEIYDMVADAAREIIKGYSLPFCLKCLRIKMDGEG